MIFNRLKLNDKRTFFNYLSKKMIIISTILLSVISIWALLIETTFKIPDEKIVYEIPEVVKVEFNANLDYIKKYSEVSQKNKIKRIYSQFDIVFHPELFLESETNSVKDRNK